MTTHKELQSLFRSSLTPPHNLQAFYPLKEPRRDIRVYSFVCTISSYLLSLKSLQNGIGAIIDSKKKNVRRKESLVALRWKTQQQRKHLQTIHH